ncbi:ATP-grasp domain-containing protein [Aerococcaceae bacterium NML191292]|nr:ATP-grasp domain-containing protein [Aerococcaceae bacterium NML191292]MCW6663991.1 ATP-grasp domain-containing protein [Aerococcaceae bacterium NML190073]MCW6674872.1 ATP-grasp domain-containing protein [Aerococcaceae bacterium NML171108]MCW6679822.1 ATP-grasp domain-containing protein [Aerococcaceae bacterium NML130460]
MPHKHYPGSTVGIIGSSVTSALLAQSAGKLGYRVASLVLNANNPVRQFASWQTVADAYDESALRYFAGRVDVVIAETGLLSNQDYQVLAKLTDVPLSEDLMAISTDRLIEKAYLDSKRCLVTPFSMITQLEDIKEAVEYIGFPCLLKATQRHLPQSDEHIILYNEEDYAAAQAKIEQGTCILEAWIPTEKRVSLTVVRNERGEVLLYPIFEVLQRGDSGGEQVRYPANVGLEVEREVRRVGQYLAEELHLIGALTVDYLVTSSGVVYVNGASIGLASEALFTIGSMSVSHFEAMARALVGLPLPELVPLSKAAIALPVEELNKENVLTQMMLRTDWGFALFNPIGNQPDFLMGKVIVTGDSLSNCERQIELTELLAK